MRTKHSNRKYTNKNRNKGKKKRHNRTLKMSMNMKMKGGADPICEQLTELKSKNIFEVFSSSIQLPKLMSA
jgi:hypothetical protein